MSLKLLIIDHREGRAAPPREFVAGGSCCNLGRDPDNDLVLDDPERLVSGHHARIDVRDGTPWLTDHSTNGTFINNAEARAPRGVAQPLHHGDVLAMGPYEIEVSIEPSSAEAPPLTTNDPFAPFETGVLHPEQPPAGRFDEGRSVPLPGLEQHGPAPDILDLIGGSGSGGVASAEDPFADARRLDEHLAGPVADDDGPGMQRNPPTPAEHAFFQPPTLDREPEPPNPPSESADGGAVGGEQSAPATRAADGAVERLAPEPSAGTGPPADIPDNYDLLLDGSIIEPRGPVPTPPAAAGGGASGPEAEGGAGAEEAGVGDLGPAPRADDAQRPTSASVPPEPPPATPIAHADAGATDTGQAESRVVLPQPGGRRARRVIAVSEGAAERPPASGPKPDAPAATPSDRGPAHAPAESDLLIAFLDGLGVGDPMDVEAPEQLLRDAGALLRALVAGLGKTLLARTVFKSEMRLGMTTIRAAENNPYKFSVGADDALDRLLFRPNPAFKPALAATEEAFDDLKAHEMAMIAGLRSALGSLLARLDPDDVADQLQGERRLEKLLPMARQARCWERFTQTYREVAADAAEDPMRVFGEAFTRAYEEQIRALSAARQRGAR